MTRDDVRKPGNRPSPAPGAKNGPSSSRELIALAAILILGLGLRLYRIDWESGWGDELFSLTVSQQAFRPMTEATIKDFVNPPGYYYMLHFWIGAFGREMAAART